ncbi:nucleotidyltransferase domain-containing protein [Bdellovibrionota bacterium FG-2]
MARVKKIQPTLEFLFFSTPEQRVLKLLISEPTTTFSLRVIASRLKGVRGVGGSEGLTEILSELQGLGFVEFVDNNRAVRLQDDGAVVQMLKRFSAICDLEGLIQTLSPISTKGILFGSRATGRARSDSDYDLFVVSETPEEIRKIALRHPLGRRIELIAWTPDQYSEVDEEDQKLALKLGQGVVLWG